MKGAPKLIHIITLGCKVNQFESASFTTLFEEGFHKLTPSVSKANIIVINTCSVTAKAGSQSRNAIRKVARANSEARIIVTGCYSQLDSDKCLEIEEIQNRDVLFIGNQNKDQLVEASLSTTPPEPLKLIGTIRDAKHITNLAVKKFSKRTRAYIRIQDGCDSFCTYCIVPYTRGPSRSLAVAEVVKQAKEFEKQGHKEIVITGIHAGNYGHDLDEGNNITSLIKLLCQTTPGVQYRLSSIEPLEVTRELLELMASTKNFVSHLHIPLQSGNDMILKEMGRRYTTKEFQSVIDLCHEHLPDCALGIDVLAGFPGETEDEFEITRQFLSQLDFTYLHVFPYSKRPGTPAAEFSGQVLKVEKDRRVGILRAISEDKRIAFYGKFMGTSRYVLIELSRDKKGRLKGFTDNYIPVLMEGDYGLTNSIQKVKLVQQDGTTILGEIV